MSPLYRLATVVCDCCGGWTDGGCWSRTTVAALSAARAVGWAQVS